MAGVSIMSMGVILIDFTIFNSLFPIIDYCDTRTFSGETLSADAWK